MGLTIQKPIGGPDVTRRNGRDILYVKGDANTDGSQRFIKLANEEFVRIEERKNGSFALTGFKFSSNSIHIGETLSLSASGSFIRTKNLAELNPEIFALIPEIPFDPEGTDFLVTPFLDKMVVDPVFPGPTVSQIVSTTISQICPAANGRVVETILHEAGSLSASDPVDYKIFVGTDNTGPLIFQTPLPPSSFVANQPVIVFLNSSVVFEEGADIFLEMTSINSFSLDTNGSGNVITFLDQHDLKIAGVFTENQMLDEDLNLMFDLSLNPMYAKQFI